MQDLRGQKSKPNNQEVGQWEPPSHPGGSHDNDWGWEDEEGSATVPQF